MNWIKSNKIKLKTKRTFLKKGTCSRTFFYIMNREYGYPKEMEEQAADPLAGGIVQQGYQCGMLWGASLGAGAESFRRFDDRDKAIGMAINSTQHILNSFIKQAKSADCNDVTNTDWTSKFSLAKFFITGKMVTCFKLAGKWAPDALKSANEGLAIDQIDLPEQPISCASEVVRRMGATHEEMVMVAGFAGGLGLSGDACGALAAAVWMNTLARVKNQSFKYSLSDSELDRTVKAFYENTNYEMECSKICGQHFKTIEEHSEFIKNGGCKKLIQILADTSIAPVD